MATTNPSRPAPPKPTHKPGHVKVVRAMFKYEAQYSDELSFEEGDILYIYDMADPDWWKASVGEKSGLIPSNYVEENTESIDHPMHEAAKRGNISFLKECLSKSVGINSLDKAGSTPLHWAAHGGHMECMQTLLSNPRCEVNVQNKLGDTPLHSAAWKGHAAAVEMLLQHGARLDIKNNEQKTPADLTKDSECAAMLRRAVKPQHVSQDYGDEEDSD